MNIFSGLTPPQVIYEGDSDFNGHIKVLEKDGVRKLYVGNTLQSITHTTQVAKKMCWGKIVDLISEAQPSAMNIMLLGLGGATIPWLLSEKFPNAKVTTVEIDKTMVEVSKKYFNIGELSNLRIINDDALRVVSNPHEYGLLDGSFDVIIVNIYQGEKYPDLGSTGNFFAGIKKLLSQKGLAIFNRLYLKHHQEDVNNFIENVSSNFLTTESRVIAGITNSDNILIYARI